MFWGQFIGAQCPALWVVLEFSRETESIGWRYIYGCVCVCLCTHIFTYTAHAVMEAKEVPRHDICKPRKQKSLGCNSLWVGRPANWGDGVGGRGGGLNPGLSPNIPAQAEGVNLPFLHLFVLFMSSVYWMMPTHIREGVCFTQCDSSANLFQRHPHRNTWK